MGFSGRRGLENSRKKPEYRVRGIPVDPHEFLELPDICRAANVCVLRDDCAKLPDGDKAFRGWPFSNRRGMTLTEISLAPQRDRRRRIFRVAIWCIARSKWASSKPAGEKPRLRDRQKHHCRLCRTFPVHGRRRILRSREVCRLCHSRNHSASRSRSARKHTPLLRFAPGQTEKNSLRAYVFRFACAY
jgi:hypothetical protein